MASLFIILLIVTALGIAGLAALVLAKLLTAVQ